MEGGKKTENITGTKENGESKIPKLAKYSSAKETSSKTLEEKKTVQSSKTTTKIATITSSKLKQTQITNFPKNVKRMSVAQVSRDVMNHFQDENLKSDDHATESDAGIKVLDKENRTKRAPLNEKFSQASQKQSGSLPKKRSAPDFKPCAAFGGIRFTAKRNACRKFDIFQKMAKDHQTVNPPEPCSKELKTTDSAKAIASKEIECSNEGNKEDPPTVRTESSKATSLTVKETTFKKCTAFGGIRFAPKWQSTPLKPDLFNNMQKVPKHYKELHPPGSSAKGPEKIQKSTKSTTKEDETVTPDETVQPPTKEPKHLKPSSITVTEIGDKMYPAFAGMRLIPKRKSTHPKPDIFEKIQEKSKLDGRESHISGVSSEQMKMSSDTAKAILKTETQHSHFEVLEQTSTQKARFSETVSITVKETSQGAAFGGIRFAPKWKSTPARPNMFESIQKESKSACLESHSTDSSTKELDTIPASTISKIKVGTLHSDDEKLDLPTTQKPELLKNDEASKNAKKVVPPAFGGLRFKPRQKNLHDVFETQKSKIDNQMQF